MILCSFWMKQMSNITNTRAKIVTLPHLQEILVPLKARGATIALANGAFDMIHVGHVRYLQAAANLADILVVAVNSDASVKMSKGPTRPIIPQNERAEMVAALSGVYYVLLFNEKSVSEVIRAICPNFHVKGTDYTPENVPESALVRALGGRVVIAGDPKDHSSTQIIDKLKES